MTEATPGGLVAGTLADLSTLMANPPGMRRGNTALVQLASPAAAANLVYTVDASWWERLVALLFTFTASAVAGLRQLTIVLANADGTAWNITPAAPAILAGEVWQVSADQSQGVWVFQSPSSDNTGTQAAPGALTVIASVSLPQGEYNVNWTVVLAGAVAAAEVDNFGLFVGTVQVAQSVNPAVAGIMEPQPAETVIVPAGGAVVAVKSIGAATAGTTYQATLTAASLGGNLSCPQLPNVILKSHWQVQVAVAGVQAGDQISAVQLLTERYPSNYADGSLEADLSAQLDAIIG